MIILNRKTGKRIIDNDLNIQLNKLEKKEYNINRYSYFYYVYEDLAVFTDLYKYDVDFYDYEKSCPKLHEGVDLMKKDITDSEFLIGSLHCVPKYKKRSLLDDIYEGIQEVKDWYLRHYKDRESLPELISIMNKNIEDVKNKYLNENYFKIYDFIKKHIKSDFSKKDTISVSFETLGEERFLEFIDIVNS